VGTTVVGERYALGAKLEDGPLGPRWKARARGATGYERAVIVEALRPALAEQDAFVDALAEQSAKLMDGPHPRVEGVYDVVRTDAVYRVVDPIDGPTLKAWVAASQSGGQPAPYGLLLSIVADVSFGLHALHGRSEPMAHGAIDTTSIQLDRSGVPYVTRFGVAAACEAAGIEDAALRGPRPDGFDAVQADVFGMGQLLYTVLAGSSDTSLLPEDLRARLMEGKPVDLKLIRDDIPPVVLGIVERALVRDPQHRYDSTLALARAIELFLQSRPETTDAAARAHQIDQVLPKRAARAPRGLVAAETDQLDLADLQRLSIPDE